MFKNQAAIKRILERQIDQDKVSHAYLFVGKDSDVFAALFARTLLCDTKTMGGCGNCGACLRFDNDTHPDVQKLSGKEASIKKEDVIKLKHNFVQSSVEESNRQVYLLDVVDNSTPGAMNSLLKYLEEPEGQTTAILSTVSENRVLETIKSRCLILQLAPPTRSDRFNELSDLGYDAVDAFYLSYLDESDDFNEVKDMVHEFMSHLRNHRVNDAVLYLQIEGIKNKKLDREKFELLCDILELLLSSQSKKSEELSASLSDFNNRNELLESVLSVHDRVRPGVNIGLIIDQLVYEVMKIDKARKF